VVTSFFSQNKAHTALQYLNKALKIEATHASCDNPAGTHLNLCAILSQLSRHEEALEHAKCALELLNFDSETSENEGGGNQEAVKASQTSLRAIACYNLAVEQEHLRLFTDAVASYGEACKVAKEELGADHMMTTGMMKSLREAKKVLKVNQAKQVARPAAFMTTKAAKPRGAPRSNTTKSPRSKIKLKTPR
jgi:tetratricopeptide (TPR) repeat protein